MNVTRGLLWPYVLFFGANKVSCWLALKTLDLQQVNAVKPAWMLLFRVLLWKKPHKIRRKCFART